MCWHREKIVCFNFMFYDPRVNSTGILYTCQLAFHNQKKLLFGNGNLENLVGKNFDQVTLENDFCRNFLQGCIRCELPRLLEGKEQL